MSDIQELEKRLRDIAVAPEDSDWADVLRRVGGARRVPRRRLVLALAACVAVAVPALVLGLRAGAGSQGPAPQRLGGLEGRVPDGSNLWGQYGRQISIDELRAEAPYIPLPDSPLANDANVGTVWVWDHTSDPRVAVDHVAAVVYYPASGIELLWTGSGLDYTGLRPGQEQTIDGVRAIVLAGDQTVGPTGATGYKFPAVSVLNLPVGPDHVLQMDGTVPGSELIEVAHTLSPSPGDASINLGGPIRPLSVTYNRDSSGELTSITVTASPQMANASAELEVFGGPPDGRSVVVYRQQVLLAAPSPAAPEQRPTWSGRLSPSDWSGGCQAGWRYGLVLVAVGPGTSLADVLAHPEDWANNADAEIDEARLLACQASAG